MLPAREQIQVTDHALDQFRLHHPAAEVDDLLDSLLAGKIESAQFAAAITGRLTIDTVAYYVLPQDTRGMFVVKRGDHTVITYLRFQAVQQRIASGGKATTPEVPPETPPGPPLPSGRERHLAALRAKEDERLRKKWEKEIRAAEDAYWASMAERFQTVYETPNRTKE